MNDPEKETAEKLIALFTERGYLLDFNGCYQATVEVSDAPKEASHG